MLRQAKSVHFYFFRRLLLFSWMLLFLCAAPSYGAGAKANYDLALSAFNKGHYPEGIELLKKSAWQGNKKAQNDLGTLYHTGLFVPRDYTEALKWYRKSANQGYSFAMLNLGLLYHKGHGVEQSFPKARSWFLQAAKKGDPDAQFNLGVMYQKGEGVIEDIYQAYVWFAVSAINGSKKGLDARDLIAVTFDKKMIAKGDQAAKLFYKRYPPSRH